MSKVKDGGITTAYGAAVRGGYAGTYTQFCADLGKLADVLSEFLDFSVSIETLAEGEPATANYNGGILSLGIPKGDTGNGIQSISLLSTVGLVKTYRITLTDDTTFDFSVSDGEDGDDGNGISGASFDAETNALTITFDDGTSFTTPSLKGSPGTPGDDGYSPAVTIETITGGHRVTITDKTHPTGQSFDVMDGQGGGGSSDYTELTNKPKINNVELDGNKTAHDLGLAAQSDIPTVPVKSVNGKTGAVNLASGDIAYNKSATYQAGSVGAELQDLDTNKQDAPSTDGTAGQVLGLDSNLNPAWVNQSGGGTSDYTQLTNKPQINGHTLTGNQSAADLGLGTYSKPASGIPKTDLATDVQASLGKADTALQTAPVQSVNGKTGAVVLSAADVGAKPDSYTAPVTSVNNKTGAVVLSASDVGAKPESYEAPVSSVAGKTGAVTLDGGDVGFSGSATYQAGTVGAELQDLDTNKQDAPSTDGTAGQILALALIDGQVVPVWITPASGGDVTDVQINGTSILEDGVANIPRATDSKEGVVKVYEGYGVKISNGVLFAANPSLNEIKSGVMYKPPSAQQVHQVTFYGLAKAAGDATQSASANAVGTYTEDAKSAISEMLNGSVAVSGTTPTIAAKAGISYVCGEVATLDITLPASGCFDVVFQSGSTPTVLTATGVTWANDFDATALEADTTYEINIKDGLGVVQKWT